MKRSDHIFGLLGKNLFYSFSKKYFEDKFDSLGITDCQYLNFEIDQIEDFTLLLTEHPQLVGLNVTIPYKQEILAYVDRFDEVVREVGATNTLMLNQNGIAAYNTDVIGFRESIRPFLKPRHERALILGTGGASKAVAYALDQLGINYLKVSRNPKGNGQVAYSELASEGLQHWKLIINTTPIGTLGNDGKPPIPYEGVGGEHLLYDLVYNPVKTPFLQEGIAKGAMILNGLDMLKLQAEASWKIWNEDFSTPT